MKRLLLALKAEVLLGLFLVTRHRAPRLVASLGLALVAAAAITRPGETNGRSVVLIGATLAGVGASRLLASGPALAAARMVTAPWWLVPAGRLLGALCAVVPFAVGVGALVAGWQAPAGLWRVVGITGLYAATLIACTMAIAPSVGASAAATLACCAVWLGGAPPAAVLAPLAPWPLVQRLTTWLWHVLPLPWRALRWLAGGPVADPLLLAAWTAVGLAFAAWQLSIPSGERPAAGGTA